MFGQRPKLVLVQLSLLLVWAHLAVCRQVPLVLRQCMRDEGWRLHAHPKAMVQMAAFASPNLP
jgi:hypothetical protein